MTDGKVALVTGASRGIGAATARALGEAGFAVGVNFLSSSDLSREVVKDIEAKGSRALSLPADVCDPVSVNKMVQQVTESFGPVDVLVDNAMGELPSKLFGELIWDDFQALLDVQIRGTVNCCQAVLPAMEEQGRGSIINIISTYALGAPPARMSAYVTAKSALLGLSRGLAVEYTSKGIRVNMVSPGPTETDMLSDLPDRMKQVMAAQNPMKRLARPEDTARTVLFLATDQSEYLSGANLVVSGGQVIV